MNKQRYIWRCSVLLALIGVQAPMELLHATDVDGTRALVEQWVETRRITAAERSQWAVEKSAIADLSRVLEAEKTSLASRIDAMRAELSESDAIREELVARRDALTAATTRFSRELSGIEGRLADLAQRLPPPLRDELRLTIEQLTQAANSAVQLPLTRRVQNVLAFLTAMEEFDRSIHIRPGVLERADGRTQEVSFIFIGLGAGYFTDASGAFCGRMVATAQGWQPKPEPSLAGELANFIAISRDPAMARFIHLPISDVPLVPTPGDER